MPHYSDRHIAEEKEITQLLELKYPELGSEDIKCIAEQLHGFSDEDLETILRPGKWILDKGEKVLMSYLAASPQIYVLTGRRVFLKWLGIANKVSNLSISCSEGFFDSSVPILRKGGIELLENWTNIEISLAKKNKSLAVAFCKFTGELVSSTETERFLELVEVGENFSDTNIKVAEAYFENLPYLLSYLANDEFVLYCHMIDQISKNHWLTAINMIASSREVLPLISPERRKKVIQSLIDFQAKNESVKLALFKNAPYALIKLNDEGFEKWIDVAAEIAIVENVMVGGNAAIAYFDRSHDLLDTIEIDELRIWAQRGADKLFRDRQSFRSFIDGSLKGMHVISDSLTKKERLYLIDKGIEIADINFECVESYFQNCIHAFKLLNIAQFSRWTEIGLVISKENSDLGSTYYENSFISLKKVKHGEYADIFSTAEMLLETDWSLAAAFCRDLPAALDNFNVEDIRKWAGIGIRVYDLDKNLSNNYFSHSPTILNKLNVNELEEWALKGIEVFEDNPASGRSYFTLKSKGSKDYVENLTGSVTLKNITSVLRYYALGLSGVNFKIRSRNLLQIENEQDANSLNPIIAGNTVYLAPKLSRFGNFEDNFRIYKLSMMHEVGHVHFSSLELPFNEISDLVKCIDKVYDSKNNVKALEGLETSDLVDISDILSMLPNQVLAASILGVIEDARVEFLVMDKYKGIRPDLENVRIDMLREREKPEGIIEEFIDALLWIKQQSFWKMTFLERIQIFRTHWKHPLKYTGCLT